MTLSCAVSMDLGRYLNRIDHEDRRSSALAANRDALAQCTLGELIAWDKARAGQYREALELIACEQVADPDNAAAVTAQAVRLENLTLGAAIDLESGSFRSLAALLEDAAAQAIELAEVDVDPLDEPLFWMRGHAGLGR